MKIIQFRLYKLLNCHVGSSWVWICTREKGMMQLNHLNEYHWIMERHRKLDFLPFPRPSVGCWEAQTTRRKYLISHQNYIITSFDRAMRKKCEFMNYSWQWQVVLWGSRPGGAACDGGRLRWWWLREVWTETEEIHERSRMGSKCNQTNARKNWGQVKKN